MSEKITRITGILHELPKFQIKLFESVYIGEQQQKGDSSGMALTCSFMGI